MPVTGAIATKQHVVTGQKTYVMAPEDQRGHGRSRELSNTARMLFSLLLAIAMLRLAGAQSAAARKCIEYQPKSCWCAAQEGDWLGNRKLLGRCRAALHIAPQDTPCLCSGLAASSLPRRCLCSPCRFALPADPNKDPIVFPRCAFVDCTFDVARELVCPFAAGGQFVETDSAECPDFMKVSNRVAIACWVFARQQRQCHTRS